MVDDDNNYSSENKFNIVLWLLINFSVLRYKICPGSSSQLNICQRQQTDKNNFPPYSYDPTLRIRAVKKPLRNFTFPGEGSSYKACLFSIVFLVGAFSGHCEPLRKFVDSSTLLLRLHNSCPPVNGALTKSISVNKTSASQSMLLFFWRWDNYTWNYQMVCSTDPQWFLVLMKWNDVYLTNILFVNITNLSM